MIIFDIIAGIAVLVWLTAIIAGTTIEYEFGSMHLSLCTYEYPFAGICNPHFLVINGYFTEEVGFNVKEKTTGKFSGKKDLRANDVKNKGWGSGSSGDTTPPPPPPNPTVTAASTPQLSAVYKAPAETVTSSSSSSATAANAAAKTRFKIGPAPVTGASASAAINSSDADDSENDDLFSPDEDRANLSIVRFAREVNSRRISTDYNSHFTAPASTPLPLLATSREAATTGSGSGCGIQGATKLDITNFPKGPLFESTSSGKLDGLVEKSH